MNKYTWRPSLVYTVMTFVAAVFSALFLVAIINLVAWMLWQPIKPAFLYGLMVVISILTWSILLCIPEDTEF